MFGLTKREQRWKAEQQLADSLIRLVVGVVQAQAVADVDVSKNDKIEQLLQENVALRRSKGEKSESNT